MAKKTTIITPRAVLSYPKLFKAMAGAPGQPLKFSCALVFTADVLADPQFAAMREAIKIAAEEKFGDKAKALLASPKFSNPLRSTDAEGKEGYPAGSYFLNARSDNRPGLVYAHAGPDGRPVVVPVEAIEETFYPGCIVRAQLSFYGFDREGNRGVGVGLSNIQKLGEGERLDSRQKAEDAFDADLTAAPADLDSLVG